MRIVQIVPEVTTGRGVEAVAFHLESEWRRLGVPVERFTLSDAAGGWLPEPGPGVRGKLVLALRVGWFTVVGTVMARRRIAAMPSDTVVICHNDVLAGDVYVNHGILAEAMRARGRMALRMVRNPLHPFTWLRDALRYGARIHKVVVNLTGAEDAALRRTYPWLNSRTVVIGNGVDVDRYAPGPGLRSEIRGELGIPPEGLVALFVGHEYERKGLPVVLDALRESGDDVHLIVVGGTVDMVRDGQRAAEARGVGARVHFVGARPDPRPWFHASDVFVFPSAYESYGLVVLEALACGLPVIATPTGCVPDVVRDGETGWVTPADPERVRLAMLAVRDGDREAMALAARRTAEQHAWGEIAKRYLALFDELLQERR